MGHFRCSVACVLRRASGTRQLTFDVARQTCAIDAPTFADGTCNGDSGGPLLANRADGTSVEVGITDFGPANCTTGLPDFFARADSLSAWVRSWIQALGPGVPVGADRYSSAPGDAISGSGQAASCSVASRPSEAPRRRVSRQDQPTLADHPAGRHVADSALVNLVQLHAELYASSASLVSHRARPGPYHLATDAIPRTGLRRQVQRRHRRALRGDGQVRLERRGRRVHHHHLAKPALRDVPEWSRELGRGRRLEARVGGAPNSAHRAGDTATSSWGRRACRRDRARPAGFEPATFRSGGGRSIP